MSPATASASVSDSARRRWPRRSVPFLALALLGVASLAASVLLGDVASRDRDASLRDVPPRLDAPRHAAPVEGLRAPLGVAAGPDGTLYVTETGVERALRAFDAAGRPIASFPGLAMPAYVAFGPSGDLFVTDHAVPGIYVFSPAGEPLGEVLPPVPLADWNPVALAFDDFGRLYVIDLTPGKHRVLFLDSEFRLVRSWGSEGTGPGQLYYPNALALDAHGRLWVSDSNNGRVLRFDPDGGVYAVIARGRDPGDLTLPRGLAIDRSRDILYVADTSAGVVNAYDIAGAVPRFLFALTGEGLPSSPGGLALDAAGRLIVADRARGRLDVWLTD